MNCSDELLNINCDDSFCSYTSSADFHSATSEPNLSDDDSLTNYVPLDVTLKRDIFARTQPCLNIVHINAQSIPAHYSDLLTTFSNVPVDCVMVSESWLKPSLPSTSYPLTDFALVRNDRVVGRGGGVCIYIRKDFPYSIISQSPGNSRNCLEYLLLEINVAHTKVLLGVLYSPSSSIDYFGDLEDLMEQFYPCYDHVILMGDLNTCLLKNNSRSLKLQSLISSFNCEILPLSATHFSPNHDPSLLDLIFVAQPSKVIKYGQVTSPFSYHDLIYLSYNIRKLRRIKKVKMQRSFARMDVDLLRKDVANVDWSDLYNAGTIDMKVEIFTRVITKVFDQHAPIKPIRSKHSPAPWLNSEIRTLMNKRDKAKSKSKRFPSASNIAAYKKLRNHCNRKCRDSKRRYIYSTVQQLSPAQTWQFLGSLGIGKSSFTAPLNFKDANKLNNFFSDPPIVLDTNSKVRCLDILSSHRDSNRGPFLFKNITESEVHKDLLSITSKAFGCDGLSRDMLVPVADLLTPIITHMLNFSLDTNTFPSSWKKAHVIPLPKVPNPNSPTQFRPISILPILSKILELEVNKQLTFFLAQNQLMTPFQSGFRAEHSTTTALLKVSEDIRLAMDNRQLTIIVLLDFSCAFNSVDFDVLLGVLRWAGASDSVLEWFETYLKNRQQRIFTPELSSEWANLIAGVPQGGVLSPTLFSMFINNIASAITSPYHLYADDLQIYRHTTLADIGVTVHQLNEDLERINVFANTFGLLVNPNKSQAVIIGNRQLRSKINLNTLDNITYNGTVINISDSAKNLGVIFDSNLSWSDQISEVSRRVHGALHALKRFQNFLPFPTKLLLVQSLILPLIDYADVVYLDASEAALNKLERLQNLCIRYVYGLRKFDHVSEFRKRLNWLPIRLRRNAHTLTLLFKLLRSRCPSYLCERFSFTPPSERPVRSCAVKRPLEIPHCNTIFYEGSFSSVAARLWNGLPDHIREAPTLHTFKLRLKRHYLNELS